MLHKSGLEALVSVDACLGTINYVIVRSRNKRTEKRTTLLSLKLIASQYFRIIFFHIHGPLDKYAYLVVHTHPELMQIILGLGDKGHPMGRE